MARWRALPAGIDPAVAALVAHLRKAKDFSGLSIKQLASATGYSTSSWERYLSGRALPPPLPCGPWRRWWAPIRCGSSRSWTRR